MNQYSHYFHFSREEWRKLEVSHDQILSAEELEQIRGLNDRISLLDISEIYLPLIKLLTLQYQHAMLKHDKKMIYLQKKVPRPPFIIALAGSVAVGKSTTARVLQLMLERWYSKTRKVELITTDGFLYPNKILEERGIMNKKGFPESYDQSEFLQFLVALKSNNNVKVPLYSHFTYDVLPETREIIAPDIVIVEGVNVLQAASSDIMVPSDFFDFAVYLDACEADIKRWYLERFSMLRETAFQDESSYFHRYIKISNQEAKDFACRIWDTVNAVNLKEHIERSKYRADLILRKNSDHLISNIYLRK